MTHAAHAHYEQLASALELGQLVGELAGGMPDYSQVISNIRGMEPSAMQDIDPDLYDRDSDQDGMIQSMDVTINGTSATVFSVSAINKDGQRTGEPYTWVNEGVQIFVVEGGVTAEIVRPTGKFMEGAWQSETPIVHVGEHRAHSDPQTKWPATLSFRTGDQVTFKKPYGGLENKCWFIGFYPDRSESSVA